MFGGGDEDAFAHQAGGVADLGDVAAGGFDFEIVEVGAAKDDAGPSGGGEQTHLHWGAAVKTDSGKFCCRGEGMFQVRGFAQTNILALNVGVPS